MANIDNLHTSISELPMEDVIIRIRDLRASRRIKKGERFTSKKPTTRVSKPKNIKTIAKSLKKDDISTLIKLIEEMEKSET